jgi:hypothetical protein
MTRQMLTAGLGNWGLGLSIGGSAEHPHFGHGGADAGFISNLVAYNDGDGVVVMTNANSGGTLGAEILRTIAHEYGWPDFKPIERRVVAVDPKLFDLYVGHYRADNGQIRVVTRDRDRLFQRRVGTPLYRLLPAGDRQYFITEVDAQYTFEVDVNGRATRLIVRQNGMDVAANRIEDSDPLALKTDAALKRIDEKIQDPQTEVALRRNIDELRRGDPSYDLMSPQLATVTRQQLPQLKAIMDRLGPLQTVVFKGVGAGGGDIYDVTFENGSTEWRIGLSADGKIEFVGFGVN